jgi:hypothetical protein
VVKGCSNLFFKGADVLFRVMLMEAKAGGGGKGVLCLLTHHFEANKVLPIGSICEQMQSSSKTNENNFGKHLGNKLMWKHHSEKRNIRIRIEHV